MDFTFSFDLATWICLGALIVSALLALWARFKPIWLAGTAATTGYVPTDSMETPVVSDDVAEPTDATISEDDDTDTDIPSEEYSETNNVAETKVTLNDGSPCYPKVSVIVYTFSEEDEIIEYLKMAMTQDYPDYEVILVNEGGAEATAELSERLLNLYPERLYVTFIPPEAHSLSRRKLANTVGMKAAKGEIAVTTASNCIIPSQKWLSDLVVPFYSEPGIDVVLGYSHINFNDLHGAGKWYREMDATLTSCQWIGAARNGHPYRGDGMNLAMRRELFFHHKGYAKSIHLVNGEDDLFLSDIMDADNTRLSISPDSILTTEWSVSGNRMHAEIKERYQFTARFLPRAPFVRAGVGSMMQWVTLGLTVAIAVMGLPSLLPGCIALALLFATWIAEICIYRRTARRLESVCLWWSLPWFLLWHPLGDFLFRMRRRNQLRKNYTFA